MCTVVELFDRLTRIILLRVPVSQGVVMQPIDVLATGIKKFDHQNIALIA